HSRAEDGIRYFHVTGVQTCALPISVFYTGGGLINSGAGACRLLTELVDAANFPITSTLMGLGAYPASGRNWLGMLGMHGLYEAKIGRSACRDRCDAALTCGLSSVAV